MMTTSVYGRMALISRRNSIPLIFGIFKSLSFFGKGSGPTDEPRRGKREHEAPPVAPFVGSVDEALRLLGEDRDLARRHLEGIDDARLLGERSPAPWGGPEVTLFQHLESMVLHLGQHKGQLFYYLKLQGKPVNTMHLWGMLEQAPASSPING